MAALDNPGTLSLHIQITVREAEKSDLSKLEWYGQFSHFRNLIRRAFREQKQGKRLMLVADYNGFPIGQIFIQYIANNRRIADGYSRAYLYSFRVMGLFQGQGIGTHIMHAAEAALRERGFTWASIAVAKENSGALRLYQRLGYKIVGEDPGRWHYTDHHGVTHDVDEPCWILEKRLIADTN